MTTVINTPATTDSGDSGAGWAVAVILLLAVIGVGAYFWLNYQAESVPNDALNVNVTLPAPVTDTTPTPSP